MANDTEAGPWVSIFLQQQQSMSLQDIDRCLVSLTLVLSFVFQLVHVCYSVLMQAQHVPALHIKCNGPKAIVGQLKRTLNRLPTFYVKGCTLRLTLTVKQCFTSTA